MSLLVYLEIKEMHSLVYNKSASFILRHLMSFHHRIYRQKNSYGEVSITVLRHIPDIY